MQPEENISDDGEKNVDSAMTTHSKEEILKDKEEKAILKDDHCSKASSDVSCGYQPYLNSEDKYKAWYLVGLENVTQRDEQRAFLLDVLKCDKSEVHSIYHFRDIISFHAFMTEEEADKFAKLEEVDFVHESKPKWMKRQKTKSRRKFYPVPKIKKRNLSTGQILSERRKNREKWRYNEDMELKSKKIKKLEEEAEEESEEESEDYYGSDSSGSSEEFYLPFDESGRRWYKVSLVKDIRPEDHLALLPPLRGDKSGICYECFGNDHLFEAYMTEEEADEVAGLEEVEFVEPCRGASFKLD